MNAALRQAFTDIAIGTPLQGGFFAGAYTIDGKPHGLVVSPKAPGDLDPQIWIAKYKDVPAAKCFVDGRSNTAAMSEAGSALAKRVLEIQIADFNDWYLPAQDELELLYRAFKPTTDDNSNWNRSGINVSALPPTYPYSAVPVAQTSLEAFQAGGSEAFEDVTYWSSSQHAEFSDYAWGQFFDGGNQFSWGKVDEVRARLVRRFPL